jgi:serine/threonine protein kinase/Tfp pilus assembly protein PilF
MKCTKCGTENPGDTRFCGQCGTSLFRTYTESGEDALEAPTRTLITSTNKIRIGANFADRYHIIEELGRGGMGRVYKALDTQVDEKLAIKVLKPEVAADEKSRERFRNELKTTRQISHRHICRVYDFSEAEGQAFITMEYVSGEDLKSLVRRIGQLTPGKAVFIGRQIAEGLAEAHRLGVIHRDLKPHNIMLDKEGNVRIMDFGIARTFQKTGMTDTGVIIGTPEYMSPEQVEGREVDGRSDIYSLGIILYEMLTGRVPFSGDTPLSVAVKQKTERPVNPRKLNPQIPQEISRLILRCLEKDKALRFQDAAQLVDELTDIEKALPKTDRVVPERMTRSTKEITVKFSLSKMIIPALVLLGLALITIVGWRMLSRQDVALFAADKPSLAIMHFENNTGDVTLQHWRKALSDLLIADLSQSRYIQVLSGERLYNIMEELDLLTASSYSSNDLQDVAERGGTQYVLVGQMTKAGETLRLNTTLQDARSGDVLGSAQVEGEGVESLFALVDDLTKRIKEDFQLSEEKLASDLDARIEEITTSSAEAHQYYNEGMTYHNRGDYTKSIPHMELAVALDPEFAMAYRAMAVAYQNLGYQNEADRRLERAFELKDRVSQRERYYIEADYFRRSEDTMDQAITAYENLLALYPDDNVGNNNLGVVYNSIEEFDKAAELFEVNVRNRQKSYHSYSNLANIYLMLGQMRKAEGIVRLYLDEISDQPQMRISLAGILMRQGKPDAALEQADLALAMNPNFSDGISTRGNVFFLKNDMEQALLEYQRLLEIEQPVTNMYARNVLSNYFIARGQLGLAEEQLQEGLELAEMVGEKGWVSGMHSGLSYVYSLKGRGEEAARAADLAVGIARESGSQPNLQKALFARAMVLIQVDDLAAARRSAQELQQAISQGLNKRAMRHVYLLNGLLLSRAGQHTEALDEFKRSRELMPRIDESQAYLSDAMAETLWASGEPDKARRFYSDIQKRPLARLENSYLYVRSFYQIARTLQEQGKDEEALASYRQFLDLWKDADPGIPMLQDARQQLRALSQ